jgi:exodeoxyribonuclease VII large subunit
MADFAADRRAPTPTAAAEMVSPSREELLLRVVELAQRATREALRRIEYAMQTIDALARRLEHPRERLRTSGQLLAHLAARLALAAARRMDYFDAQIGRLKASLASLNPAAVLERGYSLTRNAQGEVVRDAAQVPMGERLTTTLAKGWLESEVRKKGA